VTDARPGTTPRSGIDFEALARDLKPLGNPTRLDLLHFLVRPHYLEEVASHLSMARQAAEKHVEQLVEIGVVRPQSGRREHGPVTEYVLVPQRLFAIGEEFGKLGVLRPERPGDDLERTIVTPVAAPARPGPGTAYLAMVHGMRIGAILPLTGKDAWTIGRDKDRDVVLDYDPFASNRHAEIVREGSTWSLVDTFSTNGTYLNWERLPRGGRSALSAGDVVGVGKTLLVFKV